MILMLVGAVGLASGQPIAQVIGGMFFFIGMLSRIAKIKL